MTKFSERIGAVESPNTLQIEEISDALRNSMWNLLYALYEVEHHNYWIAVAKRVAHQFRKVPADEVPYQNYECRNWLKAYFFSLLWYEAYDFVEFVANNHRAMTSESRGYRSDVRHHRANNDDVQNALNRIFERELSGYRFIEKILSPITDESEIQEIANAVEQSLEKKLQGVREHLHAALSLLGKKPEPDYRNSIKESISAVESVAKQISGNTSKGIDDALEALAKKSEIHGALKAGFKSLYGFSSDSDGIRHAILEQPNVGFIEAKYMLVACSAFVNYLIQKADDAKLL